MLPPHATLPLASKRKMKRAQKIKKTSPQLLLHIGPSGNWASFYETIVSPLFSYGILRASALKSKVLPTAISKDMPLSSSPIPAPRAIGAEDLIPSHTFTQAAWVGVKSH